MRPRALLPALALALAVVISPMMIPGAAALAPVIDGSEHSTYRAWNDEIVGMSVIDRQYGSINDSIMQNSVTVDGFLLINQPNGPYPWNGGHTYGSDFATTADYYVCWLDESYNVRSFHVSENVGVTGGQNCWGGQITKIIYRAGWWTDDVPTYAAHGAWIESCHISLTVKSPITYQFEKVATWQINSAFSESIYLVAEYSLEGAGNADYTLSDDWNHPSATKPLWNRVSWSGQVKSTPPEYYADSLAYDIPRDRYLTDHYDTDNMTARSAYYGYSQSYKERMLSAQAWQSTIDADRGIDSLTKAGQHISAALGSIAEIQSGISSMPLDTIKRTMTKAIENYHLAILYTDKAIIEDYDYDDPLHLPGNPDHWSADRYRDWFISQHIQPHISALEGAPPSFVAWLFATPNALILFGASVSMAAVAVHWRSGAAGIAAVLMIIMNVIMWKGDLL